MRNNDTGEFELVVGNAQLLIGFFIVTLLCGAMFALGYVIGRAKSPQDTATSAPTSAGSVRTQPQNTAAEPPVQAPAQSTDAAQPSQQPAAATPPVQSAATQPDGSTPVAPPPETTPIPADGTYWQVLATADPDSARAMQKTLKDSGFQASLSPGPNKLTRVLVGPYTDTGAMGRAKTALENDGFHPVKH